MEEAHGATVPAEGTSPSSFDLLVISPTEGVASPISLPQLSTNTSVLELKQKIKDALPPNLTEHVQRLIHRGRLLASDEEVMMNIFGAEALSSTHAQTLHLVLRPQDGATVTIAQPAAQSALRSTVIGSAQPHSQATPSSGAPHGAATPVLPAHQLPPPAQQLADVRHQQQQLFQELHELHLQRHRMQAEVNAAAQRFNEQIREFHATNATIPPLPFLDPPPQIGQPSQAPATAQPAQTGSGGTPGPGPNMPNPQNLLQWQRERAASAMHGMQPGSRSGTPQPPPPAQPIHGLPIQSYQPLPYQAANLQRHGLVNPDQTRTYRQEGVGPNGERWQVTVNESTTIVPSHVYPQNHTSARGSPAPDLLRDQRLRELANSLRAADLADRQNNIHNLARSGSSGVLSSPDTAAGPTHTGNSSTGIGNPPTHGQPTSSHVQGTSSVGTSSLPENPIVYLLSSPQGPRALLLSGTESYYTPRRPFRQRLPVPVNPFQNERNIAVDGAGNAQAGPVVGVRNMGPVRHERVQNPVVGQRAVEAVNAAPAVEARNNAGFAAQVLPHIWLLVRLAGFVWFFLSGDTSWYRWITIIGVASVIFLANVGVFNGLAAQVWDPARRHLDALLPLAPVPRAGAPVAAINDAAAVPHEAGDRGAANNGNATRLGRRPEPTPEQVAARLIEQRRQRQNNSWIMQQVRRVEHAMLLFFASLVPGVGERHIMARAEQENAVLEVERRRRQAEEERLEAEGQAHSTEEAEIAPGEQSINPGAQSTITTAASSAEESAKTSATSAATGAEVESEASAATVRRRLPSASDETGGEGSSNSTNQD